MNANAICLPRYRSLVRSLPPSISIIVRASATVCIQFSWLPFLFSLSLSHSFIFQFSFCYRYQQCNSFTCSKSVRMSKLISIESCTFLFFFLLSKSLLGCEHSIPLFSLFSTHMIRWHLFGENRIQHQGKDNKTIQKKKINKIFIESNQLRWLVKENAMSNRRFVVQRLERTMNWCTNPCCLYLYSMLLCTYRCMCDIRAPNIR